MPSATGAMMPFVPKVRMLSAVETVMPFAPM
jgi:hypothetical protein